MRATALLLPVVLTSCAVGEEESPVFIEDFIAHSTKPACEPAPESFRPGAFISSLTTVGDTIFLVLYGEAREVDLVTPDLETRRRVSLSDPAPGEEQILSSAILIGDSALLIADQLGTKLRRFDLEGRETGVTELDFSPLSLHEVDGSIVVTPFVMGGYPTSLAFILDHSGRVSPLPVPTARYRDGAINTFANTAQIATYPDGRIVVNHFLMIPFARILTLDSRSPRRLPLPLPDGVRDRYGSIPSGPLDQDNADRVLAPVIDSAPDSRTGDLLYLTRTGRTSDAGSEKAIIRTDNEMRYLRSYLLDFNAVHLAYLAGPELALIATANSEWYLCHTPRTDPEVGGSGLPASG